MDAIDYVKKAVSEVLDVAIDEIDEGDNLHEALGGDSLADVEIAMNLEDQCDITFPDVEFDKIKTVGDLANSLNRILATKVNGQ